MNDNSQPSDNVASLTEMHAMRSRVAYLEQELVATRLALACAKSSEDGMRLELSRMSKAALLLDENSHHNQNLPSTTMRRSVPTKQVAVHRARRTRNKTPMNPNSCSSGLNLLNLDERSSGSSSLSSNSSGALQQLTHPNRRTRLNPNSCASGLNMLDNSFASVGSLSRTSVHNASPSLRSRSINVPTLQRPRSRAARLNPSSCASGLHMLDSLAANDTDDNDSLSSTSTWGTLASRNNLAFLLGNARILSSSSFNNMGRAERRSRSNVAGLSNGRGMAAADRAAGGGGNRNDEWAVFE